ncbi:hypothetical protein ACFQBU_19135 [Jhaorihella thermophila]
MNGRFRQGGAAVPPSGLVFCLKMLRSMVRRRGRNFPVLNGGKLGGDCFPDFLILTSVENELIS